MVSNMARKDEISPSLRDILNHLYEDNQRPPEPYSSRQESFSQANCSDENNGYENCGTWNFDQDDQASMVDEVPYDGDATLPSQDEVLYI